MKNQPPGYPLRMPPELRDWFHNAAKQNGRSLNSELVHCLMQFQNKTTAPDMQQAQAGA